MKIIQFSPFNTLLFIILFKICNFLIPPELQNYYKIPITRNKLNPNLFEVSVLINSKTYSLPINLQSNKTIISEEDVQYKEPQKNVFEPFCLQKSQTIMDSFSLNSPSITLKDMKYEIGLEYSPGCTFRNWIGLSRGNSFVESFAKVQLFNHFQYGINLTDNESGYLLIGDQDEILTTMNPHLIFCRPFEDVKRRWGCEMRGVVLDKHMEDLPRKFDAIQADTDNKTNRIFFTIKKSKTGNRYDSAFFDSNFQYILVPIKYFTFLSNFYLRVELLDEICKSVNDTVKEIVYYECKKDVLTRVKGINFFFGYYSLHFDAEDIFINIGDDRYILGIVSKSNKKGNDWIFGHIFLKKYTLIFDESIPVLNIIDYFNKDKPLGIHYFYKPGVYTEDNKEEEIDINGVSKNKGNHSPNMLSKIVVFFIGLFCFVGIFTLIYTQLFFVKQAKVISLIE